MQNEVIIRYSKTQAYILLVFGLIFFGSGIYLFIRHSYVSCSIPLFFGAYWIFSGFKTAVNYKPQIIMSDKGIETFRTPFYLWSEIKNEEIIKEGPGKTEKFFFVYDYPNGSERLEITEYDLGGEEFGNLLREYRTKHNNSF